MKKMLLVDGNSMFFRAFYASSYTRLSSPTQTVSTNAVFGFISMLNKAIELVQPQTLVVAWDSGKKTFRHDVYPEYKGTRKPLPSELVEQFPIVREYLDAARICRYQQDGLEADDLIGSLAKKYPDWDINILSSDRDLLQLIDPTTSVWLMKKGLSEIVEMDEAALKTEMNLLPSQIPDLKGLMGDASDNIPGLPGVGEKTALKLIEEYKTLENVIAHAADLKGKLGETVATKYEIALFCKFLATIKTDEPIALNIAEMVFQPDIQGSHAFFKKYDMHSLVRKAEENLTKLNNRRSVEISSFGGLNRTFGLTLFAQYDLDDSSFPHPLMSLTLSDGKGSLFTSIEDLMANKELLDYLASSDLKIGYDVKRIRHGAFAVGLNIQALDEDLMILAFLTDSNQSSIEKSAAVFGWPGLPVANREASTIEACKELAVHMHQTYLKLKPILIEKGMGDLYRNIEIPIIDVLVEMEHEGIRVDLSILSRIADETLHKINVLTSMIIKEAGVEFNINSPKQLADILFDKLQLPANKKRSTSIDVLEELAQSHPIVAHLIEFRKYQKLYSTYAQGLKKFIQSDGKIHTDYKQCVAATGRLSSIDPNLQNISIRNEETREIRKAFVADEGHILYSCDYSQIELRILAHMANETAMIEAFKQGEDIHTHTARDVFEVEEPSQAQRRQAKAVNFGIIYGISDFGLATQIGVSRETARKFIQNYLNTYRGIQNFMDETIAFCQVNGYVVTMFGRRREIPEIHDKNYNLREFGKRAAMNAPIQGSAADLIKVAMIKIHRLLLERGLKTKMILQVHDELVFHVPASELAEVRTLVKTEMTSAAVLNVPLEVSEAWGADWYEAK